MKEDKNQSISEIMRDIAVKTKAMADRQDEEIRLCSQMIQNHLSLKENIYKLVECLNNLADTEETVCKALCDEVINLRAALTEGGELSIDDPTEEIVDISSESEVMTG